MKLIEIFSGEPEDEPKLFPKRAAEIIPQRLRPGAADNDNIDYAPTRPRPTYAKHSDVALPPMSIDWGEGSVEQALDPWPKQGVNISPHFAADPRFRQKGIANDNSRVGLIPPVKPR